MKMHQGRAAIDDHDQGHDNVFRDGSTTQLAPTTGSVAEGYTSTLVVGIAG